MCGVHDGTHSGVQPSSFIHGQESVTGDAFDADDPLRNCKELQDTWMDRQHTALTDGLTCYIQELKARVVAVVVTPPHAYRRTVGHEEEATNRLKMYSLKSESCSNKSEVSELPERHHCHAQSV